MNNLREEINIILQKAFHKGKGDTRFEPGIIQPVLDKIIEAINEKEDLCRCCCHHLHCECERISDCTHCK